MKFFFIFVFCLISSIGAEEFIVAASANMQYALDDLNKEYSKGSGKFFKTVVSSSGKLAAQIQNGAPYSIFLSADMVYPNSLYKNGFAIAGPRVYAKGTIVLWTNGGFNLKNFPMILASDKIKTIAIANPETAPYGAETIKVLEYYKLYSKIKSKLVYAESISQVNQYIVSGSADLGFTAKSVVTSREMQYTGHWEEIDPASYNPIQQGMVILKYGLDNHPVECKSFYNFLFSERAYIILKKYGYLVDEL
jgi:molybdate transport system substrate-binding protein